MVAKGHLGYESTLWKCSVGGNFSSQIFAQHCITISYQLCHGSNLLLESEMLKQLHETRDMFQLPFTYVFPMFFQDISACLRARQWLTMKEQPRWGEKQAVVDQEQWTMGQGFRASVPISKTPQSILNHENNRFSPNSSIL